MCNLHDVTWGTKGDNGAAKDLGGAKKVKNDDGKEMMEVELPTAREDVDQLWNASRSALRIPPPEQKEHRDAATKQTDHDRNSRTNVVLAWVGTNMWVLQYIFIRVSLLTALQADDCSIHIDGVQQLCGPVRAEERGFDVQPIPPVPVFRLVRVGFFCSFPVPHLSPELVYRRSASLDPSCISSSDYSDSNG